MSTLTQSIKCSPTSDDKHSGFFYYLHVYAKTPGPSWWRTRTLPLSTRKACSATAWFTNKRQSRALLLTVYWNWVMTFLEIYRGNRDTLIPSFHKCSSVYRVITLIWLKELEEPGQMWLVCLGWLTMAADGTARTESLRSVYHSTGWLGKQEVHLVEIIQTLSWVNSV